MNIKSLVTFVCLFLFVTVMQAQNLNRYTSTLPATDAVGRKLPTYQEVGGEKDGKFVGLFYWTWHTSFANTIPYYDVTKILQTHPEAASDYKNPHWPDAPTFFWGEPLFGYYRDTDEWVLRKHAEMLGEAGVDVLIFDCTNGSFTWKESYMKLCEVFSKMRSEGIHTPQIAFILAFAGTRGSMQAISEIYTDLYKPGLYKDLWFYWKGKPLIMAYPDNLIEIEGDEKQSLLNKEMKSFFTFRPGQPTYANGPSRKDQWGWLEIYPQHKYVEQADGSCEEMVVGVGQNWSKERGLTAMNAPNTFGRSYTHAHGQSEDPEAVNYGLNFQEQWDYALKNDPEFIFITGWNEWIAGRFALWQQQENAFPDEYSQEKSRDIEPMKGGHGDNYYYQMVANIRRFKGMPQLVAPSDPQSIRIDGKFEDWKTVTADMNTPKGNTFHRDCEGFKNTFYKNATGRNDFVKAKVTHDRKNIYFYIETAEPITAFSDSAWMRLFIDVDRNHETGWEGYDFVINRCSPSAKKTVLERSQQGWNWQAIDTKINYRVKGNRMEVKIPLKDLSLTSDKISLEFKWSDNMQEAEAIDFLLHGDVAPFGRFNFMYESH